MVGFVSDKPMPDSVALQALGTSALVPTTGQVQGAVAEEAAEKWYIPRIGRFFERQAEMSRGTSQAYPYLPPDQAPPLTPDALNEKYGIEGWLKFDAPMPESVARSLHEQKRGEAERADVLDRNEGGLLRGGLARFMTSLAVSALDPLNVAAAFVPVVGEARYAQLLAQAGGSALARAGVRAGVGAIEGAVGTAALQPLEAVLSRSEWNDYTMTEALTNIAMGAALGGGLHTASGLIRDATGRTRLRNPLAQHIEEMDPEVRNGIFGAAVAQAAEGRDVNVAPLLDHAAAARAETDAVRGARAEPSAADTQPSGVARPVETPAAGEAPRAAAPAGMPTEALPLGDVTGFTTAKGSTYEVHPDGTTTRNKSFHPEHGEADQGPQPRSEATFFITKEEADQLGGRFQAQGDPANVGATREIVPLGDGRWGMRYVDGQFAGHFERDTVITPQPGPAPGLIPVEIFRGGRQVHFGNEITEMAPGTPIEPGARLRQDRLRAAEDVMQTARAEPQPDTIAATEAQRVAETVPKTVDEVAAQKMLAETEVELAGLKRPAAEGEGVEYPPEVAAALKASDEQAALDEGFAKALDVAGSCIADLGLGAT